MYTFFTEALPGTQPTALRMAACLSAQHRCLPSNVVMSVNSVWHTGTTKFGLGEDALTMKLEISSDVTDSPPASFALEVVLSLWTCRLFAFVRCRCNSARSNVPPARLHAAHYSLLDFFPQAEGVAGRDGTKGARRAAHNMQRRHGARNTRHDAVTCNAQRGAVAGRDGLRHLLPLHVAHRLAACHAAMVTYPCHSEPSYHTRLTYARPHTHAAAPALP
jgi:hypothetical protein